MSDMPELGSKISLISKADIRYEGRLFTVDPQECTIALANVRSFGTEDRETQYPILPQPTVYDYILFRGSDIKDIRVVNNVTIPNDPAIVQLHLPPQQQMSQQQGFPPQGFGQMPPNMGGPSQMGGQFPGGGFMPNNNMNQPMNASGPNQMSGSAIVGGPAMNKNKTSSRSTTPNNMARKSPTNDMGIQTNQNQNQGNKDKQMKGNQHQQRNNQRDQQPRERRDSGKDMQHQQNNAYRNNRQQMNNRGWNNNRMNNMNNNNMRGNNAGSVRMRGRSGGPPQGYRQNQGGKQQQGGQNRPKSTLKFDNDYDFEGANSKFEELRSQIAKLKVGDDVKPEQQVNGEIEKKQDDSGNETGAGDNEHEDDSGGYDKRKSFFDNISCEAVERQKGKTKRTDWRQERKLNSETFGIALARRGGFRGRGGGYYNRGPQNYRGQNQNYRGGNQNYRTIRGGPGQQNQMGQNKNSGNPQRNQNQQQNNQQPQQPAAQQQQQQVPQPTAQAASN